MGSESSAAVLARYQHLEDIPEDSRNWGVNAASAAASPTRSPASAIAQCCSALATLRTDIPLFGDVEELRWGGPTAAFAPLAAQMDRARPVGHAQREAAMIGGAAPKCFQKQTG